MKYRLEQETEWQQFLSQLKSLQFFSAQNLIVLFAELEMYRITDLRSKKHLFWII